MPYQGKSKTASGLHIPDEVRERETVATVVAYVLKLGPLAYKDQTSLKAHLGVKKANGFASADTPDLDLRLRVEKSVFLMTMK